MPRWNVTDHEATAIKILPGDPAKLGCTLCGDTWPAPDFLVNGVDQAEEHLDRNHRPAARAITERMHR